MKIYSFEKLNTWQLTRQLVKHIYFLTKAFPNEEKFGITSQLRRAMISVSCNIDEGTTSTTFKEKVRFLEIAYSSLMEVLNCLIHPCDLEYILESELVETRLKID
jgi:four helix bundle protein